MDIKLYPHKQWSLIINPSPKCNGRFTKWSLKSTHSGVITSHIQSSSIQGLLIMWKHVELIDAFLEFGRNFEFAKIILEWKNPYMCGFMCLQYIEFIKYRGALVTIPVVKIYITRLLYRSEWTPMSRSAGLLRRMYRCLSVGHHHLRHNTA